MNLILISHSRSESVKDNKAHKDGLTEDIVPLCLFSQTKFLFWAVAASGWDLIHSIWDNTENNKHCFGSLPPSSYSWFLFLLFCLSCEPFPVTWWPEIEHRNMVKGGMECSVSPSVCIFLMKNTPSITYRMRYSMIVSIRSWPSHTVKIRALPQNRSWSCRTHTCVSLFKRDCIPSFFHSLTETRQRIRLFLGDVGTVRGCTHQVTAYSPSLSR